VGILAVLGLFLYLLHRYWMLFTSPEFGVLEISRLKHRPGTFNRDQKSVRLNITKSTWKQKIYIH